MAKRQRSVSRVKVLFAPVPVSEAAHFDLPEDGGQATAAAGLDGAVGDALGSCHAPQALLAPGPQVEVLLQELAEDLTRVGGEAVLELGVGHRRRLPTPEEADDLFEGLAGTPERTG